MTSIELGDIKNLEFDRHDLSPIFFDIETGPDIEAVSKFMPEFKAPSNWKDPDKIQAKIDEQLEAYYERAALDPVIGQIVAFGFRFKGDSYCIDQESLKTEAPVLAAIKELFAKAGTRDWVGHNILDFDLPYMCRRFWRSGLDMPIGWREGNWWSRCFVDTMKLFALGKFKDIISLDKLARFLGHESGKNGKSGADFHALLKVDKEEALKYLDTDLKLTEFCYERIKH